MFITTIIRQFLEYLDYFMGKINQLQPTSTNTNRKGREYKRGIKSSTESIQIAKELFDEQQKKERKKKEKQDSEDEEFEKKKLLELEEMQEATQKKKQN